MRHDGIEDVYPLTPMQKGMLFHSLAAPGSDPYFLQTDCILRGNLDVAAFERAWQRVIRQQPLLRTAFFWEGLDEPVQTVYRSVDFSIDQRDWRRLEPAKRARELAELLEEDRGRGIDFTQAPLMRIYLLHGGEEEWHFVWTHHHILMDGWSMPLLFQQVFASYRGYCAGREPELEFAPPFSSYVAWLQQQSRAAAEAWWRERLRGFGSATPLPGEPAEKPPSAERKLLHRCVPEPATRALAQLGREHGITLNTFVQGAWAILLSRYSGNRDVLFGATVSGRPAGLPGAERMLGLFINTVPVRAGVDSARPVLDWLRALQMEQTAAREYEYLSLVDIQGWSEVPRGEPLFESLVVFENYPLESLRDQGGNSLKIEALRSEERTNYPLTLVSGPASELRIELSYDPARFRAAIIERVLEHLCRLLEDIAAAPGKRVGEIQMMSELERRRILFDWNQTEMAVPADCFPQLLERQAAARPDAVAVVFGEERLTYAELNSRANRLARRLGALGVGPESLVGVCLERSEWVAVALAGISKAGGAYVPLDPDYPPERLRFMLEDARPALVLTQASLAGMLRPLGARLLSLDSEWSSFASESATAPDIAIAPENLAYVIYTSGSTGRPKGAMVRHAGLTNLCVGQTSAFGITEGTSVLQFASLSFDASVPEIFIPLAHGGTVYFARRDDLLDPSRLHRLLRDRRIGHVLLPPSLLNLLDCRDLPELRCVFAVAERCPREVAVKWSGGRHFVNGYGPTENTVCACVAANAADLEPPPPIGRPVANTAVYILDRDMEPVPAGVAGELYIGGGGLARGYLGRADLTADRFVPDPFRTAGGRLYRTGDLARYRPDGNIDFLGRVDQQVKIRGFRIEPGEIEAVLESHPDVSRAAVAAREECLVAYYVAGEGTSPDLRSYTETRLPAYMVPAAFVQLHQVPLLPNGKLNRSALPAPDTLERRPEDAYSAPRTPVEELLCGIWAAVLGVKRVGRDDNFFELGGHSLVAMQLISRIRESFQREIPLRDLFDHPTPAGLAASIERALADASLNDEPRLELLPDGVGAPLSFAQERLWFLDQLEPGGSLYNNSLLVRLRGALDPAALERAFNEVVRRHEVLRTTFWAVDGRPAAQVSELMIPLPCEDLRPLPEAAREQTAAEAARLEAGAPFDLAAGPLVRARLWQVGDDEHLFLLVMHHIVCDGWSNGVLLSEMAALYAGSPLPGLPCQYRDFASWQRRRLQGDRLANQLAYWKKQLADLPPALNLPADRRRPSAGRLRGAHYHFAFGSALAERLRQIGRREDATLFMILLAGFQTLLARYTRQDDIAAGTPVANRSRAEFEPLIGFFVNTLVLRTSVSGNPRFRDLLARVRETALGAYAHQDLPFEMVVEALQPERNLSHSPLFQVMLTLNNAPRPSAALPGLELESLPLETQTARFDLTVEMAETSQGLSGSVEYNTDLFDESTIGAMIAHFERLLEAAASDPSQRILELPLLSAGERKQLTIDCNLHHAPYPSENLAHELFEQQARERPESIAVQEESRAITYAELDRRANQLARYLRERGIGPEDIVGLLLERSVDAVIAVFGVLKAGGAYLPLDPAYPADRLAFMLRDSGAGVLITSAGLPDAFAAYSGRIVSLDSEWPEIECKETTPLARAARPENAAYVIYTSGSTGQPKGAVLCHRGLCNLAAEQGRVFRIGPGSRVLQFAPFSFDASVWETFMALANGGTLCLAPAERAAMDELHEVLRSNAITTVTLPPSVLAALDSSALPDLTTVIAAGEACGRRLVDKWAPGRRFFNAYGPTETTVCASMALADDSAEGDPPIGTPLANMQLYVLDTELEPVPLGVPGELFVGGAGLARGYLHRPEKTAESFVPDPFGQAPGGRLYRTGDLVRRRAELQLDFLGRLDQQTKVRGYRVEPGEVEAALAAVEGVREAVVGVRSQQLVAWVAGPAVPTPSEIQKRLRQTLPEYLIPARFVVLPALPLNPSGKVNRGALPEPAVAAGEPRARVAPRTDAERQLAAIWGEILGLDHIGVEDDFFELGGHSLLATQVVSRIRGNFKIEFPLRALFEHPVLERLAKRVEEAQAAGIGSSGPELVAIPRHERRFKQPAAIR